MTTVLVTGGAGVLGSLLVAKLNAAGYTTRGMSRRERPATLPAGVQWVRADLETGVGVVESLSGVDVIVHAASSAMQHSRQVDVDGTRRLLELARTRAISHVVYISIVGIERIPLGYYKDKVAGEEAVMAGGVPWTILRATQFHNLIDRFLRGFTKYVLAPVATDFQYQPVDAGEVADALIACVSAGPRGRVPDMGGPEVLTLGRMIRPWLVARGLHRLVIPVRAPGALAHAFRHGYNTCPNNRQGKVTWADWLSARYRTG